MNINNDIPGLINVCIKLNNFDIDDNSINSITQKKKKYPININDKKVKSN